MKETSIDLRTHQRGITKRIETKIYPERKDKDGEAEVRGPPLSRQMTQVEGDGENNNTTPMWRRSYAAPKQAAVDQQK